MDDFKENIRSLSNTGTFENILIAVAYWLLVIVIILFVFYIAVKINNYRQFKKNGKIERDDFMH